tara:strand:+ start:93 stop:665 length:573 start_codon:yes stop_codon:yes gene_type:complete
MTRKEALYFIASKYEEFKKIVFEIEKKYFTVRGTYHEDVTQDLYIKIQEELDKVEDKPEHILKFLERYYNGHTFNIYTIVKNQYIDILRKEKKYVSFDFYKLNKNERNKLIEKAKSYELKNNSIEDKVNKYVKTFYWFDRKLFNLFRYEFKQHRMQMSKETKISQSTIYRTVKRCKVRINDKLKDQYYEK